MALLLGYTKEQIKNNPLIGNVISQQYMFTANDGTLRISMPANAGCNLCSTRAAIDNVIWGNITLAKGLDSSGKVDLDALNDLHTAALETGVILIAVDKKSAEEAIKYLKYTGKSIGFVITGISVFEFNQSVNELVSYGMAKDEAIALVGGKTGIDTAITAVGAKGGGKLLEASKYPIIKTGGAILGGLVTSYTAEKFEVTVKSGLLAAKEVRIAKVIEPSSVSKPNKK